MLLAGGAFLAVVLVGGAIWVWLTPPAPMAPGAKANSVTSAADPTAAQFLSGPGSALSPPSPVTTVSPRPALGPLAPMSGPPAPLPASTRPLAPALVPPARLAAPDFDGAADISASFAAGANPYGPWTYGWSDGLGGVFVPFPSHQVSNQDNRQQNVWFDPANYSDVTPTARENFGPDFNNGDVAFKSGALLLTPGGRAKTSYAHAVWTAPADGTYAFAANFTGQQRNVMADVHILINGRTVFDDTISGLGDARGFSGAYVLKARDTVDFAVGPQGGPRAYAYATGLDVQIKKQ